MDFNLNTLIFETNKRIVGDDPNTIVFKYLEGKEMRVSMGEVAYFFDYKKLIEVLEINNVDLRDGKNIYEILSKHVINQLMASRGQKVYPEINTLSSDLIK